MTVTTGAQDDQVLKRGQTIRKTSNSSDNPKSFFRPFSDNFEAIRNVSQIGHQEFTILKTISSGKFSKIFLARPELGACKQSLEQAMVLKAFHAKNTPTEEFFCEMDLNYFLSPHPNIATSYNLSFSWNDLHIYPIEYAQFGDLSRFIKAPLPEGQVKTVAKQLTSALEFIHKLGLVHRDVMPENVLVFQKDLSLVKLSDFGSMVTTRALLTKSNNGVTSTCNGARKGGMALAYLPPEICGILPQEKYHCYPSIDVWQVNLHILTPQK
jgi:serine/threonine protein kinase